MPASITLLFDSVTSPTQQISFLLDEWLFRNGDYNGDINLSICSKFEATSETIISIFFPQFTV